MLRTYFRKQEIMTLLMLATLCAASGRAQAVSAPVKALSDVGAPKFDVVSIHLMRQDDDRPERITNPTQRAYLKAVNVNLKSLMEVAYNIPDLRMFGGPPWLTSARFSLEAKADPSNDERLAKLPLDEARQAKRQMIAALLTERFKLVIHTEIRTMPVYALEIAKSGPRLGGKEANDDSQSAVSQLIDIHSGNNSLQILAYELAWRVGRPVLDRTGLQSDQALILRWRNDGEVTEESNAPSLFTAIQEQLGLKLQPTKGEVSVLVIDRAEKLAAEQ